MPSGLRWTIDRRNLVRAAVQAAAAKGLSDGAELLLEESNRTIPIEEGTLLRSGSTAVSAARLQAAFGWDTPYAARQHEDTRLRHNEGRRAKWAEQTMKEQVARVAEVVAAPIKAVIQ